MSKSLPKQPSLDHVKNEAKALLKQQRQGNPEACETLRHLSRFRGASDEQIVAAKVSLQEMQHALARAYGFESWKALADHITQDASFASLLHEAFESFVSKGPDHDSTGSAWEKERGRIFRKYVESGDEGFRVMMELARSDNGRARNAAAIFFIQSPDARAVDELRRLLSDPAATVRSRALRFYAEKIHPAPHPGPGWSVQRADSVPDGVDAILPMLHDENEKVQMDAIRTLSAYANLGAIRIDQALREALRDPRHKVQHASARALEVPCPGCHGAAKEETERVDGKG